MRGGKCACGIIAVWRGSVTNDLPTCVYCAVMWAQSDLYFYCTLLHTADPVKIASLNRFTSMLETLFDQEDQLSSDGTYTVHYGVSIVFQSMVRS